LPAAVKKSFDAMLEAEDKDDLEKLAAAEPKMLLPVVVLPQPLLGRTPWPDQRVAAADLHKRFHRERHIRRNPAPRA